MLHFGDVEEDTENPPIETLQEKSGLKLGWGRRILYLNDMTKNV